MTSDMGSVVKEERIRVEANCMNLLDHPLDIQSGSVRAGRHGSLAEMAHAMIERHWVTMLTLLIVGATSPRRCISPSSSDLFTPIPDADQQVTTSEETGHQLARFVPI